MQKLDGWLRLNIILNNVEKKRCKKSLLFIFLFITHIIYRNFNDKF